MDFEIYLARHFSFFFYHILLAIYFVKCNFQRFCGSGNFFPSHTLRYRNSCYKYELQDKHKKRKLCAAAIVDDALHKPTATSSADLSPKLSPQSPTEHPKLNSTQPKPTPESVFLRRPCSFAGEL